MSTSMYLIAYLPIDIYRQEKSGKQYFAKDHSKKT